MSPNIKIPEIHQEAFTKARTALGLSVADLAGKSCLSVRQIEQLENGEQSSFYGARVKFTAAKKVAAILGLKDDEAFDCEIPSGVMGKSKSDPQISDVKVAVSEPELMAKKISAPVNAGHYSEKFKPAPLHFSKLKKSPRSKLFIGFGIVLAVLMAIVSMQRLFFSESSEEVILVKEGVAEPAPPQSQTPSESSLQTPAQVASVSTPVLVPAVADANSAIASSVCPEVDAVAVHYKPTSPRKAADMVYVEAKSKQTICVVDASGKSQNRVVDSGTGAIFYGKPPFKVLTSGLGQVDVFFQGTKVRPGNYSGNGNGNTLILDSAELILPVPADS